MTLRFQEGTNIFASRYTGPLSGSIDLAQARVQIPKALCHGGRFV